MEPPLGTISFFLLCIQFARAPRTVHAQRWGLLSSGLLQMPDIAQTPRITHAGEQRINIGGKPFTERIADFQADKVRTS